MVFKPSLNITEQIADHLAELVIRGQLAGGVRIQELKIANELGVSRGSVREALLILERRHLIEIVPRKGAVVNQISGSEALELVDMLASVEQRWFLSLLNCREADSTLAVAAESLVSMDRAAKSAQIDEIISARGEFYAALLGPASRYMSGVFECLLPSSQRLVRLLIERADVDLHDIARYYRALHAALEASDHERLEELLNAFHKRLHQLVRKCFSSNVKRMPAQWSRMQMSASASSG
jgi:DNA-binding GntR family transcriptional regulator